MKQSLAFASLISMAFFSGIGCSTVADARKSAEPIGKIALQETLIAKEKQVWDAYKRKDTETLGQLLAEQFYAIEDSDGQILSRMDAIEGVAGLELEKYEMRDLAVIEINDRSAIVRYRVKAVGSERGHPFVARWSMVSSIWDKRGAHWQNVLYQETKIEE